MTQHQLSIRAQFRPEVLERVLRVVRHRGFRLCALNMAPQLDCQDLQITVTVESERPIQLLHSQLAKLIDVIQVEAGEVRQAHTAAYSIRA
ncbi:MAG: acetolactate synthase 2 small subunit [Aeromonadaceae bacterium]